MARTGTSSRPSPEAGAAAAPEFSSPRSPRVRLRLNRNGVGLLFLIFSMAYAGFSQSNTAAWLLAFLTLSLALVSLVHTWRNLHGLTIGSEPLEPVFAGELLPARLRLRQMSGRRTLALHLRSPQGGAATRVPEVRPGESPRAEISLPAPLRGHFPAFTVRASSLFPLGFFTASCLVTLPQAHFVYPRPEGDRPLPLDPAVSSGSPSGSHPDGDDFAGVRDWRMGESMRHIDWKAAARSDRLMAKQWHGGEATRLLLSWESLEGVETEARLRQLAQWVVQAARLEAQYELRLPGLPPVGPGRDEAHFHACLRALAGWSPDSV